MADAGQITVKGLEMAYGEFVVMRDLDFTVDAGKVTVVMGGSGCGKSTLLRHMIGLQEPTRGSILYGDVDFTAASEKDRDAMKQRSGVLYQGGALWSSMTLEENVALPLQTFTPLQPREVREIVAFKLSLVGLGGFEEFLPGQLSGGMRKRAALARAIALDPDFLFFDEPSAGLDPVTSKRLDDLILQLGLHQQLRVDWAAYAGQCGIALVRHDGSRGGRRLHGGVPAAHLEDHQVVFRRLPKGVGAATPLPADVDGAYQYHHCSGSHIQQFNRHCIRRSHGEGLES